MDYNNSMWFTFFIVFFCFTLTTVTGRVCDKFLNARTVMSVADAQSFKPDTKSYAVRYLSSGGDTNWPCGISNYSNECGPVFISGSILGPELTDRSFTFKALVYESSTKAIVYEITAERQNTDFLVYKWSLKKHNPDPRRIMNARTRDSAPGSSSKSLSGSEKYPVYRLSNNPAGTPFDERLEFYVALLGGNQSGILGFRVCNDADLNNVFFKSGGYIMAPYQFVSLSPKAVSTRNKTLEKTTSNIDEKVKAFIKAFANIKDNTWLSPPMYMPFEVEV